MSTASEARASLKSFADSKRAESNLRFFKAGPGEYGEGDKFIGVAVPNIRQVAKRFKDLDRDEVLKLLHDPTHETRLLALFIIVYQFERGDEDTRKFWYDSYLRHIDYINGWDLIDSSAPQVVGGWLSDKDRVVLKKLAGKPDLWSRRVSIMATFKFIRDDDFEDTLAIADILLEDKQDLIQKGVGWMLREIGNRDQAVLLDFLGPRYSKMPRTMLRYAIEKLPENLRQDFLKGRV